ncbi:extracellular solute-binding protein [Microbacterium betulae]|uniref:Extracellular solute-binding protein n=1 Tax=Microbacterium betulae TaxID=2981139 RepID=A0AA97FM86_9MICO|nr:extracellular solute-binding protein [Microbacterium sp. AB]WOF24007.1 extracellular solute-binding protein [Microbacterium sp. AB]
MKKTLPLLALASASALALTACGSGDTADGGGDDATADLTVWFMESSIPDTAVEWLQTEFAAQNEGSTLSVEIQTWPGIVEKLQTALPSASETPDLVEVGNTQASTFTSVGAFTPLDDLLGDLGGDSLVASGIEAGSWDDVVYATPLYQGARVIFYRTDLLEAAGIAVPTTIDELADAAIALNEANPEGTDDFTGMYLAAADPHTLEGLLFTYGGDYAVQGSDGTWEGALSTPESQEALTAIQRIFLEGSEYDLDSNDAVQAAPELFNEGRIGFLSYLNYAEARIDQSLWDEGKVGVMALPGLEAGEPGVTFAGGSNMAISAASPNQGLAQEAMSLIYSEEFQSMLASDGGWVPGNLDYAGALEGVTAEFATTAVEASKLTPNTPAWGVADSAQVPASIFTRIANGEDVQTVGADVDAQLEDMLND